MLTSILLNYVKKTLAAKITPTHILQTVGTLNAMYLDTYFKIH